MLLIITVFIWQINVMLCYVMTQKIGIQMARKQLTKTFIHIGKNFGFYGLYKDITDKMEVNKFGIFLINVFNMFEG